MKDDMGEHALNDTEGYTFKGMQVSGELAADDMAGIPMLFYNVEVDNAAEGTRDALSSSNGSRPFRNMLDLCAAVEELIENHETQALSAAQG